MNSKYAIVEIGSQSIRLLIAQIDGQNRIIVLNKGAELYHFSLEAAPVELGPDAVPKEIIRIAQAFLQRSTSYHPDVTFVFGTEILRKMNPSQVGYIKKYLPSLVVMSEKDEALSSLTSAIYGFHLSQERDGSVCIVDQGNGSMEYSAGYLNNGKVRLLFAKSFKLGTHHLATLFRKLNGDNNKLRDYLEKKMDGFKINFGNEFGSLILMGTAATTLAAVKVRNSQNERYSSARLHGTELSLKEIDDFIKFAEMNPKETRQIIEPRDFIGNKSITVVTGLIALSVFLHALKREKALVSGLGTRYGVPFLLAAKDKRILKYLAGVKQNAVS